MKPFNYHKPTRADDKDIAARLAAGGKLLAGGMTLLPTMKQRFATPEDIIDLSAMEDLRGIKVDDKRGLIIGAMSTHAEVAASPVVQEHVPALARLAAGIGDVQVRNRGTIGGSLANNDPAADYPAALLALAGEVHTTKRVLSADDYFTGLFSTALDDDEIIRHVHIPLPVTAAAYVKFPQPASLYALVGVFIARRDGSGDVRVSVTGAGADGVFRATALEDALKKEYSAAALDGAAVSADGLMGDIHGSAEYRAALITTLAKRALS